MTKYRVERTIAFEETTVYEVVADSPEHAERRLEEIGWPTSEEWPVGHDHDGVELAARDEVELTDYYGLNVEALGEASL